MDEDWKGEKKISAKGSNRRKEAAKLANIIYHKQRRARGDLLPGAKSHDKLMRLVHRRKADGLPDGD